VYAVDKYWLPDGSWTLAIKHNGRCNKRACKRSKLIASQKDQATKAAEGVAEYKREPQTGPD
jgi:hypothetical protein